MATIHELLKRISDDGLRTSLEKEVQRLTSQKKFGLVFEEHLPEATPLYGMKIRVGMTVVTAAQDGGALFTVKSIAGDVATCVPFHDEKGDEQQFPLDELVAVAKFGDPIYPVLEPIDKIEHGGGDLWHTLIQADNYHALQLLEYLYAGKVDCMYIDPPYNTGAKDWKYNNDYVDEDDAWRHSKWLSMMKKRLIIAKRLLNPKDSVLIVTIDEKEYLHLGMLLEELFPEAVIQMVSSVINPAGAGRQAEFSRTDEYLYFIMIGSAKVLPESRAVENVPVVWDTLRRSSLANARGRHGIGACGPNQFYPIYVDIVTGKIKKIGDPLMEGVSRDAAPTLEGCETVFPVRPDGTEMNWGIKPDEAKRRFRNGYLRATRHTPNDHQKYVIQYLTGGIISDIDCGRAIVSGHESDGSVIAYYPMGRDKMPTTNWNRQGHDAQQYGTKILKAFIGARFPYPKSIYAVYDALRCVVSNKPQALIVDFFAGSGTTLHAVNLLNAEDGGCRRCVLVTNNEVSAAEEIAFRGQGLKPGDEQWEAKGIARYVTWPRIKCIISGNSINGEGMSDHYGVEAEEFVVDDDVKAVSKQTGRPVNRKVFRKSTRQLYPNLAHLAMSDGFNANCEFFKLGFVNRDAVSLGRQFKEILTLLWMRSGAKGARPVVKRGESDPTMMVLPQNGMAILLKEYAFPEFAKQVAGDASIGYVYLVTDSEKNYRDMARSFEGKDCVQIYRHYLDNFRINKFAQR